MNGQLALLKRAVLVDGRSLSNYLSWLGGGIIIAFILFQIGGTPFFSGLTFLKTVTYINLSLITITGVIGFSSTITEEKEEATLGLLLMTGISKKSLIFSKATARIIRGLFLTLSQLPFVIISIAFGGITINQIIALYVTFISYIIFLAFFCTFFSAIAKTTTLAAILSSFILFLLFIFASEMNTPASYFNPFEVLNDVLKNGFDSYWVPEQFISHIIVAFVFYFLSIKCFQSSPQSTVLFAKKSKDNKETKPAKNSHSRAWSNALCWKDFNFMYGGKGWWGWQCLIMICLSLVIVSDYHRPDFEEFLQTLYVSASICLFMQFVFVAQMLISKEFKKQTHTALFTLPCEIKDILIAKIKAGFLATLPSVILTVLAILHVISEESKAIWGVMATISYAILYITMTFLLSLRIHLFAFVLAGFGTIFIAVITTMVSATSGSYESVTTFMIFINSGISIAMMLSALNQIESKASQN